MTAILPNPIDLLQTIIYLLQNNKTDFFHAKLQVQRLLYGDDLLPADVADDGHLHRHRTRALGPAGHRRGHRSSERKHQVETEGN